MRRPCQAEWAGTGPLPGSGCQRSVIPDERFHLAEGIPVDFFSLEKTVPYRKKGLIDGD